jgi:hypothetical protein
VWVSGPKGGAIDTVAIFNLGEAPLQVDVPWSALGLPSGPFSSCDLWSHAAAPVSEQAKVGIAAHGVAVLRVAKADRSCR